MLALLVVSAASLGLAGCAPAQVNRPVSIDCPTLITDQAIYDWGSGNFALDDTFVPEAGSSAAQLAADGGLACRWINLTSQETVDVAVSIPAAADLTAAQQDAAAAGTAAPELGDAYFRSADEIGYLDVFVDGYWLTLQSTWFAGADDAAPLVSAATTALSAAD